MAQRLGRSTPTAEGVKASGVIRLIDALEGLADVEPHSLMVLRHGAVVVEGWWAPYEPSRVHLLYSLSKSFTSTALGLAVRAGLVDLDDPVIKHFPEYDGLIVDERTRRMRVRHLAAMATGHVEDTWHRGPAEEPNEPVRIFLQMPPDAEPGTVFAYNQSATYTLATIVRRVTGMTVNDYLQKALLAPIGAGATSWQQQPPGQDLGFSGLHATTESIARLGQLYLQDGVWQGSRFLPEGWVEEATRVQVATSPLPATGEIPSPDWREGYGFQFWRSRHGYRGDGAYGQFCLVLPELDAVVAMTGQSTDMQAVLDATWTELLPAFGEAGEGPVEDARLAARLSSLALPVVQGSATPADPARWDGAVFTGDSSDAGTVTGPLEVRVVRGSGAWQVVVAQEGDTLTVPVRPSWSAATWDGSGAPVVASGGWTDEGRLDVALVFLETPHRLRLCCDVGDRSSRAEWVAAPLHRIPLREMGAPAAGS